MSGHKTTQNGYPVSLSETVGVKTAGLFPLSDSNYDVTYHNHLHHSLHLYFYPATMKLGGRLFEIKPNDITLTPKNVPAQYDLPDPGYHYCIHFQPAATEDTELQIPLHVRPTPGHDLFARLFRMVIDNFQQGTEECLYSAGKGTELLLAEMLSHSRNALPENRQATPLLEQKILAAKRILEESLPALLDTRTLAKRVGLSPNYLAKHFKRIHGQTLAQYALHRQIDQACFLLQSTTLNIKDIGSIVGLPGQQYFNKRFRLVKGISPSEFRENGEL